MAKIRATAQTYQRSFLDESLKPMSNSNLYRKAVASDMNVPIWSAGQLNRDAQDGAGMKNIADSISIMATCDFAIIGTPPKVLELV